MDIVKVGVIAILAALSAVVVKKQVQELGLVLALVAGVLLLSLSMEALEGVRSFLDLLSQTAGLSPAILSPVLKTMGIAIVTKLSAELCRDAKEGGIAAFVETAGTAMALFVSLPLLRTVLSMITELL